MKEKKKKLSAIQRAARLEKALMAMQDAMLAIPGGPFKGDPPVIAARLHKLEQQVKNNQIEKLFAIFLALDILEVIVEDRKFTANKKPVTIEWLKDAIFELVKAKTETVEYNFSLGSLVEGMVIHGCPKLQARKFINAWIKASDKSLRDAHRMFLKNYNSTAQIHPNMFLHMALGGHKCFLFISERINKPLPTKYPQASLAFDTLWNRLQDAYSR